MSAPELRLERTQIPGLLVLHLPVHTDGRGWFKENWQRAAMTSLGLPDFGPVQNNVSFNASVGVTRGVHAEPWDKLVSVVAGRVLGAWVDLREGDTFGAVVTLEIGPETAVFVPQGVGNAFQTLETATAYSYLVNDHWSAAKRAEYTFCNVADPRLGIDWPVPLADAELSEADRTHPPLAQVTPMRVPARPEPAQHEEPRAVDGARGDAAQPTWRDDGSGVVVLGAGGQLGRALARALPGARLLTRAQCDLTDPGAVAALDLDGVHAVINAAAYTKVDAAENPDGRREAWAGNVSGVAALVRRCAGVRLVHVSSDYVFDGTVAEHTEDEPFSPLGVYGQTKAAGDALVATLPQHLIVRTSWVVGDGPNFVATMRSLAERGISPSVVDDQHGRLTFTDDLAAGIVHLLASDAAAGTYNLTNAGPVQSWADIAADVFELSGRERSDVTRVGAEEYGRGKQLAPRPVHSALHLAKITSAGFAPREAAVALRQYLRPGPV